MIDTDKLSLKDFDGMLVSTDLSDRLAVLHRRKATVNTKIYEIQNDLHQAKGNNDSRASELKVILNNYMAEQSGLNDRIKEFSTLYRQAIDQILLQLFKEDNADKFNELLEKAKAIYSQSKTINHVKNKKG